MPEETSPFEDWQKARTSSDYRYRQTQASVLTKRILSSPEYLFTANRVNPGPWRNYRASIADSKPQVPHNVLNEDRWGWHQWIEDELFDGVIIDTLQLTQVFSPGVFAEGVFQ